jgi:hypothetical protein
MRKKDNSRLGMCFLCPERCVHPLAFACMELASGCIVLTEMWDSMLLLVVCSWSFIVACIGQVLRCCNAPPIEPYCKELKLPPWAASKLEPACHCMFAPFWCARTLKFVVGGAGTCWMPAALEDCNPMLLFDKLAWALYDCHAAANFGMAVVAVKC